MTGEDAGLSRRQWRAKHKPPRRRGDPVFEIASWLLPAASVGMLLGSFGGRRGPRATPEESAAWVIACAAVIVLLLVAVMVRLAVRRGHAPLSVAGAAATLTLSLLSMVIVLARNDGVLSPTIIVMLATNAVCVVVGCVALAVSARRRPTPLVAEDGAPTLAPGP
jgi:hypothetical protein